jgi:hypothetical protein
MPKPRFALRKPSVAPAAGVKGGARQVAPGNKSKNGVGCYTYAVVPLTPERPYYTS